MKYLLSFSLTLIVTSPWIPYVSAHPANIPVVHTSSGKIQGHRAPHRPEVYEYLGIPYAKPPVGDLRFAKPQPYSSDAHFEAKTFSPSCPYNPTTLGTLPNSTTYESTIVTDFVGGFQPSNEDCLTVNVWTRPSSKKKPVLVWLYGGTFQTGGSAGAFYNGQYFAAAEDVILVSYNFRSNIFGFAAAPGLTPNVGMLDQRLAFEWIRENIANFGGDPDAITFAGQSSGGMSMDYYSHTPTWQKDPIARAMIFESGQVSTLPPNALSKTEASFRNVTQTLGCAGGSNDEVLSCMRSKNTSELLKADKLLAAVGQPAFQATVDDFLVFNESVYEAKDKSGDFLKIPTLLGNNDYEAGFFRLQAASAGVYSNNQTQWALLNQVVAVCPAHFASAARANHSVPTWRYRYFGAWPNLELYQGSGAWHGSETPMWFGTSGTIDTVADTQNELKVSQYMMKAWAAFVADPDHGLEKIMGWPKYSVTGNTLVQLAYQDELGASFNSSQIYDVYCTKLGYDSGNLVY